MHSLKRLGYFATVAFAVGLIAQSVQAEQRIALAIGNSNYVSLNKLPNAEIDAAAIAATLGNLKFSVTLEQNQSLAAMSASIDSFIDQLRKNPSAAAVFYYAGHGLESKGVNYLVPIEARIGTAANLETNVIDLSRFIERVGGRNRVAVIILDACREDPFKEIRGRDASLGRGLASMVGPRGSIIAYATAPGEYASDGRRGEKNGPYAKALLKFLPTKNLKIEELFKRVRRDVIEETNGDQVPWEATSLTGDFSFAPPK